MHSSSTSSSSAAVAAEPRLADLDWWKGAGRSIRTWMGDEVVTRKAAALSYYTAFSLAPMVFLLVMLFGLVVDTQTFRAQLVEQAGSLLGEQGGDLVKGMLDRSDASRTGWSAAFGILTAAIGATTVFAELKSSLDDLLHDRRPDALTLKQQLRARAKAFGIIAALGFLLLITLVADALLAALSGALAEWIGSGAVWVGRALGLVVTFGGTFLLFYAIYHLLPQRELHRTALLTGAVASTLLFALGRIALGLYLGRTEAIASFGAAGSLAIVLIWVYFSAIAFFVGALMARYVQDGPAEAATEAQDPAASSRELTPPSRP